jgi:hypothetical protein
MKFIYGLLFVLLTFTSGQTNEYCGNIVSQNNCISFSVGAGTGCQWMCNYCANQLGTNNYYFTNDVCTYETGGCVGNPQAGVTYTCCSN